MSPSPRVAAVLAGLALALFVVPVGAVVAAALVLAVAVAVDAAAARTAPAVERTLPAVLARGAPAPFRIVVDPPGAVSVRVRQPLAPDVDADPSEADDGIEGTLVIRRRGRHELPPVVVRAQGPLGLGRWDHTPTGPAEVRVYPDLPAAHRLALSVRQGRFRDPGQRARGPLGLGTDFESVRDYVPDDDVRRINWTATARLDRPMSNQYREDTERDVVALVDAGRLMAAPVGDGTRLDAALDAVAAVAAVADAVGDRCGAVAFDSDVRLRVRPRRANGEAVVRALYDLEPTSVDSDHERAFRDVGTTKRALVMIFTDLLEEAAARPLLAAVPILARRHAVVVATITDPDLHAAVTEAPAAPPAVYAAAVATGVLAARDRVRADLVRTGATVVEADPERLAAACVGAYLRLKSRSRL